MAREHGVHHSTVARVWIDHEIKPHRHKTFKLSRDVNFVSKLIDVVGVYLSPPQNAVVLCVEEKARFRLWIAPSPACRWRKGAVALGLTTTSATAPQRSSRRWMSPQAG
jgi:hypothetical protein